MRVANVSHQDLCAIGTNLCRGLPSAGHEGRSIALQPPPFEMGADLLWSRETDACRRALEDAELVHVNSLTVGFTLWLRRPPYSLARAVRGRRIVVQYHGTDLRRSTHLSVKALIRRRRIPAFVSVPDLLDHLPGAQWLPIPVNPEAPEYSPTQPPDSTIRISHAPTTRAIKKTGAFLEAVERLRKKYDVEPVLIENRPYAESLALKRTCHINFDNIGYGSYALGSIESMLMEQPTLVYLNDTSKVAVDQRSAALGLESPFLQVGDLRQPSHDQLRDVLEGRVQPSHTEEDVASIARGLEELITDTARRRSIGRACRKWATAVHDQKRVAQMAGEVYARAPPMSFNVGEHIAQLFWWGLEMGRNMVADRRRERRLVSARPTP